MNNRLAQDAADTLASYEAIAAASAARGAAFREAERARWERVQPPKIVGTWAPTITEQERMEREAQALPF